MGSVSYEDVMGRLEAYYTAAPRDVPARSAELVEMAAADGAALGLARAVCEDLPRDVRQVAAMVLRNNVVGARWDATPSSRDRPVLEEEKEPVRRILLERALDDSDRRVRVAAARAVGSIAAYDWPVRWPGAAEELFRCADEAVTALEEDVSEEDRAALLVRADGAIRAAVYFTETMSGRHATTALGDFVPAALKAAQSEALPDRLRARALRVIKQVLHSCGTVLSNAAFCGGDEEADQLIVLVRDLESPLLETIVPLLVPSRAGMEGGLAGSGVLTFQAVSTLLEFLTIFGPHLSRGLLASAVPSVLAAFGETVSYFLAATAEGEDPNDGEDSDRLQDDGGGAWASLTSEWVQLVETMACHASGALRKGVKPFRPAILRWLLAAGQISPLCHISWVMDPSDYSNQEDEYAAARTVRSRALCAIVSLAQQPGWTPALESILAPSLLPPLLAAGRVGDGDVWAELMELARADADASHRSLCGLGDAEEGVSQLRAVAEDLASSDWWSSGPCEGGHLPWRWVEMCLRVAGATAPALVRHARHGRSVLGDQGGRLWPLILLTLVSRNPAAGRWLSPPAGGGARAGLLLPPIFSADELSAPAEDARISAVLGAGDSLSVLFAREGAVLAEPLDGKLEDEEVWGPEMVLTARSLWSAGRMAAHLPQTAVHMLTGEMLSMLRVGGRLATFTTRMAAAETVHRVLRALGSGDSLLEAAEEVLSVVPDVLMRVEGEERELLWAPLLLALSCTIPTAPAAIGSNGPALAEFLVEAWVVSSASPHDAQTVLDALMALLRAHLPDVPVAAARAAAPSLSVLDAATATKLHLKYLVNNAGDWEKARTEPQRLANLVGFPGFGPLGERIARDGLGVLAEAEATGELAALEEEDAKDLEAGRLPPGHILDFLERLFESCPTPLPDVAVEAACTVVSFLAETGDRTGERGAAALSSLLLADALGCDVRDTEPSQLGQRAVSTEAASLAAAAAGLDEEDRSVRAAGLGIALRLLEWRVCLEEQDALGLPLALSATIARSAVSDDWALAAAQRLMERSLSARTSRLHRECAVALAELLLVQTPRDAEGDEAACPSVWVGPGAELSPWGMGLLFALPEVPSSGEVAAWVKDVGGGVWSELTSDPLHCAARDGAKLLHPAIVLAEDWCAVIARIGDTVAKRVPLAFRVLATTLGRFLLDKHIFPALASHTAQARTGLWAEMPLPILVLREILRVLSRGRAAQRQRGRAALHAAADSDEESDIESDDEDEHGFDGAGGGFSDGDGDDDDGIGGLGSDFLGAEEAAAMGLFGDDDMAGMGADLFGGGGGGGGGYGGNVALNEALIEDPTDDGLDIFTAIDSEDADSWFASHPLRDADIVAELRFCINSLLDSDDGWRPAVQSAAELLGPTFPDELDALLHE